MRQEVYKKSKKPTKRYDFLRTHKHRYIKGPHGYKLRAN